MEKIKTIMIALLVMVVMNGIYIPEASTAARVIGNLFIFVLVLVMIPELEEKVEEWRRGK